MIKRKLTGTISFFLINKNNSKTILSSSSRKYASTSRRGNDSFYKNVSNPPRLDDSFPTIYKLIKRNDHHLKKSASQGGVVVVNHQFDLWKESLQNLFQTKLNSMEKSLKIFPRLVGRNKQQEMRPIMEELLVLHYLPIKRWICVMNEVLKEGEFKFLELQMERLKSLELELKSNLELLDKYSNEVYNERIPYMDELFEQYLGGNANVSSFQLPNVKSSWRNDGKTLESYENTHSLDSNLDSLLRDEFIKGRIHRDELMLKEPSEFLKIFENGLEIVKPHAQNSIQNVLKFFPFQTSIPIWKLQNSLSFIRTLMVFPHLNIEKYGKFSTEKAMKDFISMNKGNFYFTIYNDKSIEKPFIRLQCHEFDKRSKSFGNIYIIQGKRKSEIDDLTCKTFSIKEGRTPGMVIVLYGDLKNLNSLEYRALIRSLAFSLHELILLNNDFSELDTLSSNFKYVIPFLFETIATDSKMSSFTNLIGSNTIQVAKFFNKKYTRPLETREEFIKNILLLKLFLVHYKTEVDPVQFFNDEFRKYLKEIPNLETLDSSNVNYTSLLSKKDIQRPDETFNVLLSKILAGQLFEIYQLADYEGRKQIIMRLLSHSPNRNGEWSIDDFLKLTKTQQICPDYFASKRFRTSSNETNAAVIALTLKLVLVFLVFLLLLDIYRNYIE